MANVSIPDALLARIREAAAREAVSVEELVLDALERRLRRKEWAETLEFGERHARARGLRPEDVDAEIAAARAERRR